MMLVPLCRNGIMKLARKILGHFWFIHSMVLLGLLALWGFIEQDNDYILLGVYMSFSGAMCGAFIRVVDAIRSRK
jgi:hypothetical protein